MRRNAKNKVVAPLALFESVPRDIENLTSYELPASRLSRSSSVLLCGYPSLFAFDSLFPRLIVSIKALL
jgi:hypothetical protein